MKHIRVAAVFAAVWWCGILSAQQQGSPQQQALAAPGGQSLAPQQLEELAAPIALYPDTLLSQILVASTYPLEVVEAQQWLQKQGSKPKDRKLMENAQHQNWDPSVQALVAFPDVLTRLNQDIRWTTDLGNAFLAQQPDVMAAVQRLRARAQMAGKLTSTPQENVSTATDNGQTAIQIQPVNPETVYVPDYNPAAVWGPPEYGDYPPLFYPPMDAGFSFWPGIDLGLYFGGGWGIWGGFGWGWGPDWFGGNIFVNNNFFHRYGFRDFHPGLGGGNVWMHDPAHRLGVSYGNRAVANRFRGAEGSRGVASGAVRGRESEGRGVPPGRSGFQGSARQSGNENHSAFGGIQSGSAARMQSDHGFSSMGHAGFGGGGMRGGVGGMRGGGGRR